MNTKNKSIASFILGFCIMLFSGVFYAWSLFRVELQAQFPEWSASAASLNLSVGGQYTTTFIAMIVISCLALAMLLGILAIRKREKIG